MALPLSVLALVSLIGLLLLAATIQNGRRWLRLRRQAPIHVMDLEEASGTVVVSGVARAADGTVTAPLSDRDCLAYSWRAIVMRTMPGYDRTIRQETREVDGGRDAVAFLVDDGTGEVLVEPERAEFTPTEERIQDPATVSAERLFEGLQPGFDTGERKYFEGRLDENETVVVQGRVVGDESQRLRAGRVGVRIGGGGHTVVADTTPDAAARAALRSTLGALVGLLAVGGLAAFLLDVV